MTMSSNSMAEVVRLLPSSTPSQQHPASDTTSPRSLYCGATMTVLSHICCIRLDVCAQATVIRRTIETLTEWGYLFRVTQIPGPSDQILQSIVITLYLKDPRYFGVDIDFAKYCDTIHSQLWLLFLGWRVRFPRPIIEFTVSPGVVPLRAPR